MGSYREQQKAFKEARKIAKDLIARDDINDVQLGYKYQDGKPTKTMAIRVNVVEKKSESEIPRSHIIKKKIASFPTDVLCHKELLQTVDEPPNSTVRPVLGGLQIQSDLFGQNENWGTLGAILNIKGHLVGITNYHVVFGKGMDEITARTHVGDAIVLQPQRTELGEAIGVAGPAFSRALDYATVMLSVPANSHQSIDFVDGVLSNAKMPIIGDRLFKIGAATVKTFGIIDALSLVDPGKIVIRGDENGTIDSGVVSIGGDSGSLWISRDDSVSGLRPVALHFGGFLDQNIAFARAFTSISSSLIQKMQTV